MRGYKVLVAVPSLGTWHSAFGKSLALMFSDYALNRIPGAQHQLLSLLSIESSMLCWNREQAVIQALRGEYSHILFLDCDMSFPPELLRKLLMHKKDYVAANCTTRTLPVKTVAHDFDGEPMVSKGKAGLEKAQHTGLAVALIACEPLKKLTQPLFLMDWIPYNKSYCGEDVYFTQKLSQLGIDLWVDHRISQEIKHIGQRAYGHDDVEILA